MMGGLRDIMMLRSEQLRNELEVSEDQWEDLQGCSRI